MINEHIAGGRIVPAAVTVKLLKQAIDDHPSGTVLVDGFPR
jgi:adenylate kinase family enzyme